MMFIKSFFKVAVLASPIVIGLTLPTSAQSLPAPINGVSFEEWAAANARMANNMDKAEVERILGVTDTQFQEVGDGFTKEWKAAPDPSGTFAKAYGEAFANPNGGRFAATPMDPHPTEKLASFEDYARVQGHLQAAVKFGIDPQTVLREHGLTTYEFSQEATRWVKKMTGDANNGDTQVIMHLHDRLAFYEAEYSKRYAKP
ncbi:hypothetical protein [Allorhizobium taibaishanense]|uniref:DUF4142 domain-containing protein n=1 Tax=Allorhizobium taibaishanense TaxID=887144 RepID=A0A1Q9A1Z3_9HYPH|nr:hypothetical protein [Allorhizobium taibaishanense]MBB4009146.1 hypothetical protein [Allorhizobium taibaishanense]OLP48566.1 hypothetical protein BJF91_01020 [Allorhizobium taibaishanense]